MSRRGNMHRCRQSLKTSRKYVIRHHINMLKVNIKTEKKETIFTGALKEFPERYVQRDLTTKS